MTGGYNAVLVASRPDTWGETYSVKWEMSRPCMNEKRLSKYKASEVEINSRRKG
jgi:hypothetical protein